MIIHTLFIIGKIMSSTSTYYKKLTTATLASLMALVAISTTGCSTTHEFKPTASVMVGAHKSL